MSETPLTDSIKEIEKMLDQQEVEQLTKNFWKLLALQLAEQHQQDARAIVSDICAEVESQRDRIKAIGREAEFMDAISQFKAEASENGLR